MSGKYGMLHRLPIIVEAMSVLSDAGTLFDDLYHVVVTQSGIFPFIRAEWFVGSRIDKALCHSVPDVM